MAAADPSQAAESAAPPLSLELVVAADQNNGIGVDGDLPWHLPGDMKYFKGLTSGDGHNAVIMGRKTWQSIPQRFRPLPQRWNWVLSRGQFELPAEARLAHSLTETVAKLEAERQSGRRVDHAFVIGGGQIYAEALRSGLCSRIYLTRVFAEFDCDAFLPDLAERWQVVEQSDMHLHQDLRYQFQTLELRP